MSRSKTRIDSLAAPYFLESGVAKATIANFEANRRQPFDRTLHDLRRVLEREGLIFIDRDHGGAGVLLRDRRA